MTHGWRLALRNLNRTRRRNLATAMAIALGTAGLVVLGGYVSRIESFLRVNSIYVQHRGHVSVYKRDGLQRASARPARYSLGPDEQRAIATMLAGDPRVEFTARFLRGMGLAGNGCRTVPFVADGLEPAIERRLMTHPEVTRWSAGFGQPLAGRLISSSGEVESPLGLSAGLARLLGKPKVHDELRNALPPPLVPDCASHDAAKTIAADANIQLAGMTFDGSLSAVDGEVVNTFHTPTAETDNQTLVAPLDTLQRLYGTEHVTYVAVFVRDWRDTDAVARDLRTALAAKRIDADVYTYTDERANLYYVGSMAFMDSLMGFIVLLVSTVVALGVMNAVTLTVFERTREIGTFRALGCTRRQVVALFVRETAILAGTSAVVGVVLASLLAALVWALHITFMPPGVPGAVRLVVTPTLRVCLWVTTLLVGLATLVTWVVARRRLRERTAELLTATTA